MATATAAPAVRAMPPPDTASAGTSANSNGNYYADVDTNTFTLAHTTPWYGRKLMTLAIGSSGKLTLTLPIPTLSGMICMDLPVTGKLFALHPAALLLPFLFGTHHLSFRTLQALPRRAVTAPVSAAAPPRAPPRPLPTPAKLPRPTRLATVPKPMST